MINVISGKEEHFCTFHNYKPKMDLNSNLFEQLCFR